jgi:antitoxin component YwqK of YwqJK toxin-antitoxin module
LRWADSAEKERTLKVNWDEARTRAAVGLQVAWREATLTAKECSAQARRLVGWGSGAVHARRLEQRLQTTVEALGERIYATGQGDPALRKQLDELAERRKNVEAAKGPTKLLDAERRGLFIRLAEPFLAAAAPAGVEEEHREAVELRQELHNLGQSQAQQRAALWPEQRADRVRVAAGFGSLAAVLLLLMWLVRGSNDAEPGIVDRGGVQVPIAPPVSGPAPETPKVPEVVDKPKAPRSKPVVKETQVEEDDYFPRRRVVATYVNDEPHGECKCYDGQNRLIATEYYKNGVLHGTRTSYYPSGKKFNETQFDSGKANGKSTTYFENGQVAVMIEFQNGVPHGKHTSYFENGNKFLDSTNVQGVPHGERLHFLPNGVCFGVSDWENGQRVGQQVQIDPTQSQFLEIDRRSKVSNLLKDYWR